MPIGFAVMILGVAGFWVRDYLRPKVAGLKVESEPAATVYIDGNQVGVTPYEANLKPAEVSLRLVPMTTTTPLAPYEANVKLFAGATTVVKRWFGPSDEFAAGEIVTLERYEGKDKGSGVLVVTSVPDAAAVRVNGVLKGFTPLVQDGIPQGSYQVAVVALGLRERLVDVKVEPRHRLNLAVKLAREEATVGGELSGAEASASGGLSEVNPTGVPGKISEKPYVEIKETPTGWLRVRGDASTGSEEVGRVGVGGKYKFIEKTAAGWYKIEYELGKEGWISAQYAGLVE